MTVFTRSFHFDIVTRIWDIFLSEDFKIVLRVCLALLKYFERDLLDSDFDGIMEVFKQMPVSVDVERLMAVVWEIPLKRHVIQELSDTYEMKTYLDEKK